jgi:Domain of unknown function (DUF4190)
MTEFHDQPPLPPQQPIADGYPPPQPYPGSPPPRRNGLGTASVVLGIVAVLLSWVPVVGLVLGVWAVATGVPARKRVKRREADNDLSALAGVVLGILAIVIDAALLIWMFYAMISYQTCIGHATGRYEYSRCG